MILAIIQARVSSTRLPGKVLAKVLDKPLIGYCIERLQQSKRVGKIILATSTEKSDDQLVEYVQTLKVPVFRGSEADVLDRFYQAARPFQPETVIRVTGDCPLFDPAICDHVIDEFLKSKMDHVQTGPTFAEGVDCEAFSFAALEKAWKEARLQSEREHVTLYFVNHPDKFKRMVLKNSTDDSRYRMVVDEPEDLVVVKAVIEHFYGNNKQVKFNTKDVIRFLNSRPDIMTLNSHVIRNEGLQKSLKNDKVVF